VNRKCPIGTRFYDDDADVDEDDDDDDDDADDDDDDDVDVDDDYDDDDADVYDDADDCYVFVDIQFTRRSKQLLKSVIKTRHHSIVQTVTL